ncbi:Retinoblastoma-associated protein [Holothuria leucospilota]|uniref:Retinoblastoma-associated protein n=1 Tax=Holothuria leucospilota TaxID=206669 RepID=A0A9Q1H305_HOLLE|nr:Retinoblastoma-associated protein [Holothuria leucospilota]
MGHFPSSRVVAGSGNPEVSYDFLHEFQMKMQQLGYIRLKEMCAALEISGELENSVWTCLDHCIMERPGLLKNRHLDQIMMCCIFEIFKANKEDIANIIAVYSKMPQAVSSTYNHVKLNDGTYGKISDFYKLVFIDALKDFIIRFQPNRQSPHISPGQSTSLSLTPNQRMAYHLTPTLRISPFTASCSKSACQSSPSGTQKQMTPGQKSLLHFVFGEEQNSPKLQEFNQTLHLQAKRKTQTQRQGSFKRKKKLKLEDSKCEVGSNTEGSKQPAREESITPEDVTSEGDIILSGRAILRDRLSNQRAGSPTEEWISDNEEPQEDNSDGDKEEKPTSNGDETSQHSSEGHKEDTDAMT